MFQLSCLAVLQCKGFNIHVFQLTVLSVGYATGFSTCRDSCTAPLHPLTKLDPPSTPIEITFTILHAASADVVSVCLDYFRNKPIKHKSSLYSRYYAEACNEWRGPSPRFSAWVTQLQRNIETLATLRPI